MADIYKYDKLGRLIPGKTKYDKKKGKKKKSPYDPQKISREHINKVERKKVNYKQ